MEDSPKILYLCDHRACDGLCVNCDHTQDIRHARNFNFLYGRFVEEDISEEPKRNAITVKVNVEQTDLDAALEKVRELKDALHKLGNLTTPSEQTAEARQKGGADDAHCGIPGNREDHQRAGTYAGRP